jgi:hypothetical protein
MLNTRPLADLCSRVEIEHGLYLRGLRVTNAGVRALSRFTSLKDAIMICALQFANPQINYMERIF